MKLRRVRWVDQVSSTGNIRNEYTISVEKPESKHHLLLVGLGLGTTILFIRNINGIGCENVTGSSVSNKGLWQVLMNL
jgi:hypothetical protein